MTINRWDEKGGWLNEVSKFTVEKLKVYSSDPALSLDRETWFC